MADQGRIWLQPWLQNLVKTDSFGPVQLFKIRSKLDEIQLKFSSIYQNSIKMMDMKFGNMPQSQIADFPFPIATPPSLVKFIRIITL
jgi:hypothetical protein